MAYINKTNIKQKYVLLTLQSRQSEEHFQIALSYPERVYLPRCKVTYTPFHIQGDELFTTGSSRFRAQIQQSAEGGGG